jgi:hypothetical protein
MTRWSLRRLLGMSRGNEREHELNAALPLSAQHASRWFDGDDQYDDGQPGTGKHGLGKHGLGQQVIGQQVIGQHGAGQHGADQPSSAKSQVALLTGPPRAQPAEPSQPSQPSQAGPAQARPGGAWPDICDQFGLHLLVLAEQLRTSLDELEADEADPERLHRLYQVDHAVTRMRRVSRDLRTLAGRSEEELAGFTTSLLDVIRMAASAIERYTQVSVGRITDLAVLGYAADDVGALMAALLDNATRYSPGTVTVSGHLLEDGGVMFRVEDTGIGIGADQVATLNTVFAGPVPEVDERTGRHTGFPVVHAIARKHSIAVRLASRPLPSSGTVAMVTLPPHLLSEVPAEDTPRRPEPATRSQPRPPAQSAARPSVVADMPRRVRRPSPVAEPRPSAEPRLSAEERLSAEPQLSAEPRPPAEPRISADPQTAALPRREPASLRGDEPRPAKAAPLSPQQQEAARRAFADELSAFSAGSTGPQGTVGATTRDGTETEEGGQS